MTDYEGINFRALRDTLITYAPLQAIVAGRYYWLTAPDDAALPYITMAGVVGAGDMHNTANEGSDMTWEVLGHTAKPEHAVIFRQELSKLDRQVLVTTNVPALDYSGCHIVMPLSRAYNVQNNMIYAVGYLVNVRLSID